MSTKEKVTVNPTNEKEEKNMTNAFDDEMDLRDDAQIAAEEEEENNKRELQERKHHQPGFVRRHKKAIIIGGVVVGVAAVGFGLWGVSNIGRGRTFFGRRKFNSGHHHGHYNVNRIATTPVAEIPATGNDAAKVIDFANELTRTADTMKATPDSFKVAEI